MSCLTCIYCQKFNENKMRCWEVDSDHALVLPLTKAKKYSCASYRNIKDKRCCDCAAFDSIGNHCMNVNNGKISDSIFIPKETDELAPICKYFRNNDN